MAKNATVTSTNSHVCPSSIDHAAPVFLMCVMWKNPGMALTTAEPFVLGMCVTVSHFVH